MNFSENISNKLTEIITKELEYSEDNKEIIAYAIETVILFVLGSLFIIICGYIFDALMPAAIATIFGVTLRKVSGGAHFDTPFKCLAIGSITYGLIGVLAKIIVYYSLNDRNCLIIICLAAFLIVTFFAPVDSEAKPIHSSKLKLKLKTSSIIFVILSFTIISLVDNELVQVSAILGVTFQSITLLPIFNKRR
jgi:Membrane protein putatively involved in post-translational modification of the autoinducing quorum-sensing peptide